MKKYNVIKLWHSAPNLIKTEYISQSKPRHLAVVDLIDEYLLQSTRIGLDMDIAIQDMDKECPYFRRFENGVTFIYRVEESVFDAIAELTKPKIKYEFSLN